MRLADATRLRVNGGDVVRAVLNGREVWSATPPLPDSFGDPFLGGFFAGVIDTTRGNIMPADASQQGLRYALIVAPASMDTNSIAWKAAQSAAPGAARTRWDGLSATQAMLADSGTYPAAEHCASFSRPDTDASQWYLPAMDELELIYRNLKPTSESNNTTSYSDDFPPDDVHPGTNPSSDPASSAYTSSSPVQTPATAFQEGGAQALGLGSGSSSYYWSSTEGSASYAWNQAFSGSDSGIQFRLSKTSSLSSRRVRPVRRLLL